MICFFLMDYVLQCQFDQIDCVVLEVLLTVSRLHLSVTYRGVCNSPDIGVDLSSVLFCPVIALYILKVCYIHGCGCYVSLDN